jgi:hypothetical protein
VFADNVNHIVLVSGRISINKNLTINGGSGDKRVIIDGNNNSNFMFSNGTSDIDITFNINNLTLTQAGGCAVAFGLGFAGMSVNMIFNAANCDFTANTGGAVYIVHNTIFNATNCNFIENTTRGEGGAVCIYDNSTFIATNCNFTRNTAVNGGAVIVAAGRDATASSYFIATNCNFTENQSLMGPFSISSVDGDGGAVNLNVGTINPGIRAFFIADNCNFVRNTAANGGGAINSRFGNFTTNNCNFIENTAANNGGAVNAGGESEDDIFIVNNCNFVKNMANFGGAAMVNGVTLLFTNSTFYRNTATINGGAISTYCFAPKIYSYHCTFDNNQALAANAVYMNWSGYLASYNNIYIGVSPQIQGKIDAGTNLIEGENGVTRELIFGEYKDDNIAPPLIYAQTATRLNNSISVPADITVEEVLTKLATDQAGNLRPATGYVTFGATEYKEISVEQSIKSSTVSISPNPTVSDFTVSFEVLKSGDMRMTLTDLSGREVLGLFDGYVSDGAFTHTVTTNNLAKGVYFLNISIDGNSSVEKVIVE